MKYQPVKSSNIDSVGYDAATQTMGIKFKGGAVHHYSNVPQSLHDELVGAKSVGGHFHKAVRGKFPSAQVNP